MSSLQTSALIAFLAGGVLAVFLVVPYVAWSYRRRGELGIGHAVLAGAFLVYLMALWTYTLVPVPDTTAQWCAQHATSTPQLRPLQFVTDIRREQRGTGVAALLHNPALQQFVFNVALFVPLGMFGRHLLRRGVPTVLALGVLASLLIELTQFTAVWGLFRCPYRIFDVDDLLANGVGTAVGVVMAPVLRLLPAQAVSEEPEEPRPVTAWRRLLGMMLDLLSVALLGWTAQVVIRTIGIYGYGKPFDWNASPAIGTLLPAVLLLLLVPLFGDGGTFGQRVVLLAPVDPGGSKPSVLRILVRFLTGTGGFFVLVFLDATAAGAVLAVVSVVLVWRTGDHRGLSGLVTGTRFVDVRAGARARVSS
ncbi:Glycopeptide antibiotics resistance protein [Amycolatopsis marina]|uniref:Glycopeptide antibiotics resistance protein n=1 Tax=Amycolatopsis marina TaxID=490629 RepID=A0A1I0Y263_9PSEU|nr:VanZ family protein [Amycolatopsis marina]SFB06977.1 Glycopeptide antibiotics resistance protein [Amycolatopsis marina]